MRTTRSRRTRTNASGTEEDQENIDTNENAVSQNDTYEFDGVVYDTYIDMVHAKRARNKRRLVESGLVEAARQFQVKNTAGKSLSKKKKKRSSSSQPAAAGPRRKSNRLAGVQADGAFVHDERGGRFTILHHQDEKEDGTETATNGKATTVGNSDRERIKEGQDISLKEATTEFVDDKWLRDDTLQSATDLISNLDTLRKEMNQKNQSSFSASNNKENADLVEMLQTLKVKDGGVAKVTPNRIYSVACHPSTTNSSPIVAAGDKGGFVGIWKTPAQGNNDDALPTLLRLHRSPVSNLVWTRNGGGLLSASYDGTIRWMDVESGGVSRPLLTTYDSTSTTTTTATTTDAEHTADDKNPGYGLTENDHSTKGWVQYVCMDHRSDSERCLFLSTSLGEACHIDTRVGGQGTLTFRQELSEKKINSLRYEASACPLSLLLQRVYVSFSCCPSLSCPVLLHSLVALTYCSLHPNGYSLISAGLDCTIKLWDVRKFGKTKKTNRPIAEFTAAKSINSAFFSPHSGHTVVSTTMADTLDLLDGFHLAKGNSGKNGPRLKKRIRHNNKTGRWLSTFMAQWHPGGLDMFVVGSMRQPRTIEIFNAEGEEIAAVQDELLTAVCSRCCFHPSTDTLAVVGGNSSGRVTVAVSS